MMAKEEEEKKEEEEEGEEGLGKEGQRPKDGVKTAEGDNYHDGL